MKTNQVLTRKMGNFDVLQRTKDGMFNATGLLKQWNLHSGQKKMIGHFFESQATEEFINTIISKESLSYRNSVIIKSRANKGDNSGTWMHPLLFIDFAMWLNPSFKYDVLKFVYDELVKYRNDAGDAYREMSVSIARLVEKTFLPTAIQDIAKALNYIVFNDHQSAIRNKKADESKLKELFDLEKDIAKLINFGFITSFEQLKSHLRERWAEKWQPKVLTA